MSWGEIFSALGGLTGFVTLLGFILFYKANRRKLNADAKKIESEAKKIESEANNIDVDTVDKTLDGAFRLIGALQSQQKLTADQVVTLSDEASKLKRLLSRSYDRIEYLMRLIWRLVDQMKAAGMVPCEEPDEWKQSDE